MRILDRYLLTEMLWPFLGGLLTFAVLISGHMLFLAIEVMVDHHVPLSGVLRYVTYQLPEATVMALPVSSLLAASLALNRLAKDHELIPLRSGGMNCFRMMRPALWLGGLATLGSVWLSGSLAPRAQAASERLMRNIVLQQRALVFNPKQFFDTGRGLDIYVDKADHNTDTLSGVYVFCLRGDDTPLLLWAPRASFGQTTVDLVGARSYALEPNGSLSWLICDQSEIDLTRLTATAGLDTGQLKGMSWRRLWQRWRDARRLGPAVARPFAVEFHSRLAMAFACLVFALLAGPVTLRFGRGQSLVGVLATILIVFVFYVVMLWSRMLGTSGALPPAVAVWGQDVVLLLVALYAIWKQR